MAKKNFYNIESSKVKTLTCILNMHKNGYPLSTSELDFLKTFNIVV